MPQVIHEMSRKKLGMTTVLNPGKPRTLAGIISDGDLRRLLERVGPRALDRTAGDIMNRSPQTMRPQACASEALAQMEERKITSLVVVDRAGSLKAWSTCTTCGSYPPPHRSHSPKPTHQRDVEISPISRS